MSECKCGGCTCGSQNSEMQNESQNINSLNNLWKTPTIYPNTDGAINE